MYSIHSLHEIIYFKNTPALILEHFVVICDMYKKIVPARPTLSILSLFLKTYLFIQEYKQLLGHKVGLLCINNEKRMNNAWIGYQ